MINSGSKTEDQKVQAAAKYILANDPIFQKS